MNEPNFNRAFYLPRLPREFYQGDAVVHWTLAIAHRRQGWLTESFHAAFREFLLHVAAREGLFCPTHCLMPDHLHLVWMGLGLDSDQVNGMTFLRRHLRACIKMWRQASLPAVEGGILPPGKSAWMTPSSVFYEGGWRSDAFSAGLEARLYVSQDGRRYIFRQDLKPKLAAQKFQHQPHDHVLKEEERRHNAFVRVCHYILDNPRVAELTKLPDDWPFSGAVVPGYPTLHPSRNGFWPKFWKHYAQSKHPDAGNIVRPPIS